MDLYQTSSMGVPKNGSHNSITTYVTVATRLDRYSVICSGPLATA
jgi:hypothetical protein